MGLRIIMGNVRRVMCKVPLTSMHKPISKYHSALVSSPRSEYSWYIGIHYKFNLIPKTHSLESDSQISRS